MAFELFETRGSGFHYNGIKVSPQQVLISTQFFKLMGKPSYLKVFIDKEQKAIGFTVEQSPGENTYKIVSDDKQYRPKINCIIGKTMPCKRYFYFNKNGEMFVLKPN